MTLAVKQCSIWSEGGRQRQRDRHREGKRKTQREHHLSCEAVQHLVRGREAETERQTQGERKTHREHDLSGEAVQHLVHGAHVDVLVDALHAHRLRLELNAVFDHTLGRSSVHA